MSSHAPVETLPELPFFAHPSRLPSPLPTAEEIEQSDEVLKEFTGRRVVLCREHYVVKYGYHVSLMEGENLLMIGKTLPDRVPEVYALYSAKDEEGRTVNYIVTQRIIGHSLESIWDKLESAKKYEIAERLRSCFNVMRSLPSPDYFGCIGRRPFEDNYFWTAPDDNIPSGVINGPFDSESDLNSAFIKKYLYNSGQVQKAAFYRHVLPGILRGHKPVFTHGDLQRKNVMIREDGTVVLIDWEAAGWYPEYWEYTTAVFACGAWKDDWHEFIPHILGDEYPSQYVWFNMLFRELWS
ncbi:hypothetical protein E4U41_007816 [Claviceps citrina]|nr:hypothetical protein E4U41_007816 [Claviceps citrina]